MRLAGLSFAIIPMLLCGPSGAAVVFHQAEAGTAQYAPIDFNGNTTRTIPGSATGSETKYIGQTFHAYSGTASSTYLGHADTVGATAYASGTVARPFVDDIYNETASDFLNNRVGTFTAINPSAPAPATFGNSIKVSNHSWAGTYAPTFPNADEDAIRRIDFMINREDVVFVASAAFGGVHGAVNLPWSARNGIAVRGPLNTFAPTPTGPGRNRADIWSPSEASFAAARVSGFAAALIGEAQSLSFASAQRNQVVKSLLMTGANKATDLGIVWTRDTANHLDIDAGAGKADYNKSLSILQAGQRATHAVVASTITGATASTNPQGWAFDTVALGTDRAIVIQTSAVTQLTATLIWNVTQTQPTPTTINTSDAGRVFANLDLELLPLTLSGGNFIVGASLGDSTLVSAATDDNVEHLYSTSVLPAGYYAFVIKGDASLNTDFGFSYDLVTSEIIPEPSGLALVLTGLALALRRRR